MRPEKAYAIQEMGKLMEGSSCLILTTFVGLDSTRMNSLRRLVKENAGRYFVVKNRMFGIAAASRGLGGLCEHFQGPAGVIFAENDSLELLRAVVAYGKQNDELKILGGVFDGEVRPGADMLAIATMPPREVVAATLLGTLVSPLSELVQVMSEPLRSLVLTLSAIHEKKESSVSKEGS